MWKSALDQGLALDMSHIYLSKPKLFVVGQALTPEQVQIAILDKKPVQINNLSKRRKLSLEEISIVEKVLKFCPTPQKANIEELNVDI